MTREEAIKRLKEYAQYSYGIWHDNEEDTKAFDMAIEALQAESVKHGEWIKKGFNIQCSECNYMPCFDSTEALYNYCPNCGADMRGDEE